ncbi:uncharacterized protein LOC111104121 isoform X2 [Crassostrea virginica]
MGILLLIFRLSLVLLLDLRSEASITPVTKCDNKERVGSVLNVDFMEMNQPCNCEVKPLFNGQLVFASNVILYDCYSNVTVRRSDQNDDTFAISCPTQYTSKVYSVSNISVFEISSDYLTRTRTGDTGFHQSIQIFQDKSFIEYISVRCSQNEDIDSTTSPIIPMTPPRISDTSSDGLIIGLVICGILIASLICVIVGISVHFIRNKERSNEEEKERRPEPTIAMSSIPDPQTSSYTTLVAGEINNAAEGSYTGLQNDSVYQEILHISAYERPITAEERERGNMQREVPSSINVQQDGSTDL